MTYLKIKSHSQPKIWMECTTERTTCSTEKGFLLYVLQSILHIVQSKPHVFRVCTRPRGTSNWLLIYAGGLMFGCILRGEGMIQISTSSTIFILFYVRYGLCRITSMKYFKSSAQTYLDLILDLALRGDILSFTWDVGVPIIQHNYIQREMKYLKRKLIISLSKRLYVSQ